MSRKKTLVALGYFDNVDKADEVTKKEEETQMGVTTVGIDSETSVTVGAKAEEVSPKIVEQNLYFCQFCDKFFETQKGKDVHESRWCKKK